MSDQARWTEALKIEQAHGRNATRWVAERATWLELLGNDEGARRMRQIGVLLEGLRTVAPQKFD